MEPVSKHHPLPWTVVASSLRSGTHRAVEIYDAQGERVLPWSAFDSDTGPKRSYMNHTQQKALARFIVNAVNAKATE